MVLLNFNPALLLGPMDADAGSGFPPPASSRDGFQRTGLPVLDIFAGDKVYVAVGKSVEKAVALLRWSFRRFSGREICLLHVHQPSPSIPTLLGKLPAAQANSNVVCMYRREERDQMEKLLLDFMSLCSRSKVKACFVATENDQIRKGIVDLVNEYGVRKLVMGAAPENWMKVKSSSKSSYVAENAPSFCQIWFVHKSQLLYTRAAADGSDSQPQSTSQFGSEAEEENLYRKLEEVNMEAEASRNEAFHELLKRRRFKAQAMEANTKVKAYESAHAQEVELRKTAAEALNATKLELEKLLEQKETIAKELQKAMKSIVILDSQVQAASRGREETARELKLVEASLSTLKIERQMAQKRSSEAANWVNRSEDASLSPTRIAEFSLLDLQTATCNFSESFRIDHEGYGSVYKGEILNATVMIKKLHLSNSQGESEFQREVRVLGKLRHKHLLSLIGVCPEANALVYEYMPESLETQLCSQNWKTRTRFISEIANALLFLHSSTPENIVHGNLKPANILLDSKNGCKICNFRWVNKETTRCGSFRQYGQPKGAFSFTDPEFSRTGILTEKSDVYSFGAIVLWMLTGKRSSGLASEVRKAGSDAKVGLVLDESAGEWPNFVARWLADLGSRCCEPNGRDRPVLTPIMVKELEQLYVLEDRQVPSFFLCPILKEIMHDPQVAADGFTYEGGALRGWLENGRQTSPMTNVKLSHLNLTPNRSLRLALEDWLRNP